MSVVCVCVVCVVGSGWENKCISKHRTIPIITFEPILVATEF